MSISEPVSNTAGKSLVKSKTFWVNSVAGIVAVLTAIGQISALPPQWAAWTAASLAVFNILLRLVTGEPIVSVLGGKK